MAEEWIANPAVVDAGFRTYRICSNKGDSEPPCFGYLTSPWNARPKSQYVAAWDQRGYEKVTARFVPPGASQGLVAWILLASEGLCVFRYVIVRTECQDPGRKGRSKCQQQYSCSDPILMPCQPKTRGLKTCQSIDSNMVVSTGFRDQFSTGPKQMAEPCISLVDELRSI